METMLNKTHVTLLPLYRKVCPHAYKKKNVYTEDRGRAGVLEEDEEQAEEDTMETTREDKKVG